MKRVEKILEGCRSSWGWLFLLLLTDLLVALVLWLMDARAFGVVAGLWTFFTILLWCAAVVFLSEREGQRERRIMEFLDQPDKEHEEEACAGLSGRERRVLHETGVRLRNGRTALKEQELWLTEYEEYIEAWAHEVKTPLALMTLMLDNRRNEMGEEVHHRLEYSGSQIQGYVEQMLFYARMRAVHKDYLMERVSLRECCEEVLEQFEAFFKEHDFLLTVDIPDIQVVTDRRSICFLISQVLANAVKYRKKDAGDGFRPQVRLEAGAWGEDSVFFRIGDNGIGVKKCDLPFLFEKGFTGGGDGLGSKATGMGLYLVKNLASDLKIHVKADSEFGAGFRIEFLFPFVKERNR